MSVAIIGAGWAGLACAVTLAEAGIPITVFEAGRIGGGRARSVQTQDWVLDNGQHLLTGAYTTTLGLMQKVGVSPEHALLRLPLHVQDARGFTLSLSDLPSPLNLSYGLLKSKGISLKDKLRAVLAMKNLAKNAYDLPADLTVEKWLLSAFGKNNGLNQHLWRPLCLAAMNTPAPRASARVFANVLRDSLGSTEPGATDLLIPKMRLGKLFPEPAVEYLSQKGSEVRWSKRVRSIEQWKTGWLVEGQAFSQVVVATGPQHVAALTDAFAPGLAPDFDYEPITTLYLRYPTPTRLPAPLFHLAGVGQWVVDHTHMGRPGLLACVQSGQGPWCELSDEELMLCIHEELQALPGLSHLTPPINYQVIREHRATYSCQPGLRHLDRSGPLPGLYFAGDHTWPEYPATLEAATRSGVAAACQILIDQAPEAVEVEEIVEVEAALPSAES